MGRERSIQAVNRARWRRLAIGTLCIAVVIAGAVVNAVVHAGAAASMQASEGADGPMIDRSTSRPTWHFEAPETGPDTNAPLHLEVTASPATPRIGETVTFTVRGSDPDAPFFGADVWWGFGDWAGGGSPTEPPRCNTAQRTPTPTAADGTWARTYTHTYRQAGSIKVFFVQSSSSQGQCLNGIDSLASTNRVELTINVAG